MNTTTMAPNNSYTRPPISMTTTAKGAGHNGAVVKNVRYNHLYPNHSCELCHPSMLADNQMQTNPTA